MLLGANAVANEHIRIANSVTPDEITFNFAQEYTTGQFLDGQWWVHNNGNDVVITSMLAKANIALLNYITGYYSKVRPHQHNRDHHLMSLN